jgi:hypothetical protein
MAGGRVTRRVVLKVLGAATVSALVPMPFALAGCSSDDNTPPEGPFFSDEERRALGALSNIVIPPEPGAPGGAELGAAPFIERLLTAFDVTPPAIYADGPYSGRQAAADGKRPDNDFTRFRPLDRVMELSWRIRLYGSKNVPGGSINEGLVEPVVGLRDLIRDNVRKAISNAPAPLETLSPEALKDAFINLDKAFQDALVDLVPQAAFGAPEYGGNPGLAGWKLARFEGDSQPLGYSIFDEAASAYRDRPDAPMTIADPGPDPAPLDNDIKALMAQVVSFTGGRTFP